MKKIFALTLAILMLVCFTACVTKTEVDSETTTEASTIDSSAIESSSIDSSVVDSSAVTSSASIIGSEG